MSPILNLWRMPGLFSVEGILSKPFSSGALVLVSDWMFRSATFSARGVALPTANRRQGTTSP